MRIYVINIASHVDRRRSSEVKLHAAGLEFEFFEAITGRDALDAFADFDADEFRLNTGREITIGEVGCFASHRALWQCCARLDEPILIMEDDFDLLERFTSAVQQAIRLAPTLGFIRLQTALRARRVPLFFAGEFTASRFSKAPHSTMCYVISPETARCFVAATEVFDAPVDVFIKTFWEHGQPLHALTPYTVAPSVMSAATTIEGRIKERGDLLLALRRLLRKSRWYRQRWLFNLSRRIRSQPVIGRSGKVHTPTERGAQITSKKALLEARDP